MIGQKTSVETLAGGVPITMLIPLYARAAETQAPQPMIRDEDAVQMVAAIDYDYSTFADDAATLLGIAIRTQVLDEFAGEYIAQHPDACIINLGAGLDTRFSRVDNGRVRWYDLDLPESIAIRHQFIDRKFYAKLLLRGRLWKQIGLHRLKNVRIP